MIYSRVKLPTKEFTKNGSRVLQNNGIYLRMRIAERLRDDLYTLNMIFPSNPEKCHIKACKRMKHAVMRNGECTLEIYTLHEGVHKKCTTSISNYQILETS